MAGTDVAATVRELAPALRAVLDERIELALDIGPGCPPAACRREAVEDLLLLAIRPLLGAMLDSGRLRIGVHPAQRHARGGILLSIDGGGGRVVTRRLAACTRPCWPTDPATASDCGIGMPARDDSGAHNRASDALLPSTGP
ncbi:hypothetical protein [Aquabacterium humicola]|uniref:hypothetical protein n=1 Tax=Aquabacterium humicola TaxID=3237377 RepID=UPI0025436BB8|nr:hypothetical protein [Rubrivivax pictus]